MVAVNESEVEPAAPSDEGGTRRRLDWGRYAPYLLGLGFAVVYATVSLARLHRYDSMSWDVAIFEQAIKGYAHLDAPIVNVKGPGYNLLGDHFSPALVVFAPFYRLFPGPETLMVGQALLVAISVAVITRLAMRRIGTAAGLAIGVAYGLSWGIQSGVNFDFHEICLAMPLLALAGAAYVDRRWPMVVAWSAPLLLVKEDMGLTLAALGVCLVISGARRWGIGVLLGSLVGFCVTVFWLIPAANVSGSYDYWSDYGSGTGAIVERLLSLPEQMVSPATKVETLLLLLAVSGFLALRSPYVLLVLPTLTWRFLNADPYYWSTDWHYSMTLMPIMFVALIDGMVRARDDRWAWLRRYASHVPAVAVAVGLVLCLQFPFRDLVKSETYDESPRADAAERVLDLIPEGASVETDIGLMTPLAAEREVYWIGNDNASVVPEYVLVDTYLTATSNVARRAEQMHPDAAYERVFFRDGYQLARRVD